MEEKKLKERICIGILAHVDAGKTTLSEEILYRTGAIRNRGRVDNRDTFLDTDDQERARGITIFSKQAVFPLGDWEVTLLDTPGHVDFSAEMERTLSVLDYAVLIVSGADGVQGHTETLWRLLKRYQVPVFLFVNKMDQPGTDRAALLKELKKRLSDTCVAFDQEGRNEAEWQEEIAMCDEHLLEGYLSGNPIEENQILEMIRARRLFPCYFGSALKGQGVEELLEGIHAYARCWEKDGEKEDLGARVYKISRDEQGNRLTHLKILSGILKVKDTISGKHGEEKVNQIRIYSGSKYETVSQAEPGCICAVTGLDGTWAGQAIGEAAEGELPLLEPVLTYQIRLPEGCDAHVALLKLRQLEEEEPELHIVWNETLGEIQAQVMGQVQIEILKRLIADRFGMEVEFGAGSIVYKETIAEPVEGVGHFEPLRHYAEVHLWMEPGERGSGLQFETNCSEDMLDRNWQRLILTHLEEKRHVGTLMGAEITDMKITLIAGRAHQKHTEGGDFRQATYRAVRQGLREAGCHLLEPYYSFRLEIPTESVGRALTDLERMSGTFDPPELEGGMSVIRGQAPVATMRDYQMDVVSYTKGRGKLICNVKGYERCHNEEEVLSHIYYDPDADLNNPTGSVFCAHGAGFTVSWDQVKEYMQVESPIQLEQRRSREFEAQVQAARTAAENRKSTTNGAWGALDKELEAIFTRTYGEKRKMPPEMNAARRVSYDPAQKVEIKFREPVEEYLLVDGYNIIFAWEELNELARTTIDGARHKLMDILCNYQGYKKCTLILVFDAYKVTGNIGQAIEYHNIHVVYTKEAETADQYIEKLAHKMGRNHRVTVATSDGLEQLIIRGQGCHLMSARDLKEEVDYVNQQIRTEYLEKSTRTTGNKVLDQADPELAEHLEKIRQNEPEQI